MLAFGLVVAMFAVLVVGFGLFMGWVLREHVLANKWRQHLKQRKQDWRRESTIDLPTPAAPATSGPTWEVTYKDGNKTKTILVSGPNEGEALKKLVSENSIGYHSIVSSIQKS